MLYDVRAFLILYSSSARFLSEVVDEDKFGSTVAFRSLRVLGDLAVVGCCLLTVD